MAEALRGMVLAAGYGRRLAPLTDHVPKPLLTVGGTSLLEWAIGTLAGAGCAAVAVNTHHLGAMITAHLQAADLPVPVTLFPETRILGTGGALAGARDFLGETAHFLLHNGDVLWDGDAAALVRHHRRTGAMATLLLTDWPAVNTVMTTTGGEVLSLRGQGQGDSRLTYTGIGVFSRGILADIGAGFSSLVDPLERALANRPGSVQAVVQPGVPWSDLGTLSRYLTAVGDGAETAGPLVVQPLTGHGSDRRFWRLRAGGWSAVAMRDVPGSEEFARQVAITRALHTADLGTAEILTVEDDEQVLLMEDLGDRDLWSRAVDLGAGSQDWLALYEPVVDHLMRLQDADDGPLARLAPVRDRTLGLDDLRWETSYFQDQFLQGYCGLNPDDFIGLDAEFDALARTVAGQPRVLIHRDFQSRNIMFSGGLVRLVDVQGMRQGPLLYDLASLLWDPYVAVPQQARTALLDRFAAGVTHRGLTRPVVQTMFLTASLQRLMQALGAFGFLGRTKGKPEFLSHIPRALAHLRQVLAEVQAEDHGAAAPASRGFPSLTTLVDKVLAESDHEVTDE